MGTITCNGLCGPSSHGDRVGTYLFTATTRSWSHVLAINYMEINGPSSALSVTCPPPPARPPPLQGVECVYVGIGITAIGELFAREELKITQITPLCAFGRKLNGSSFAQPPPPRCANSTHKHRAEAAGGLLCYSTNTICRFPGPRTNSLL